MGTSAGSFVGARLALGPRRPPWSIRSWPNPRPRRAPRARPSRPTPRRPAASPSWLP
uniref:Uncharacterized protein n=1 Tax=Phenylobacterium glaciei TaxID=2803784 RepID=A0A974P599_9CAUL|nr:hypothetical protein JKL49_06395 [Phenylobacterium glaciei]